MQHTHTPHIPHVLCRSSFKKSKPLQLTNQTGTGNDANCKSAISGRVIIDNGVHELQIGSENGPHSRLGEREMS